MKVFPPSRQEIEIYTYAWTDIIHVSTPPRKNEQTLVSLQLKKTVDAEGWCTKAVVIEAG